MSAASRSFCARTMSRTVMSGKSGPYGLPVAGFGEAGAVEPYDEPSMLDDTTKKRVVSIALPGPMSPSQEPAVGSDGEYLPAACWLDVKPCVTRIALRPSGASRPYVS